MDNVFLRYACMHRLQDSEQIDPGLFGLYKHAVAHAP